MVKKKRKKLSVDEVMGRAKHAASIFKQFDQEQTDRIVKSVYEAGFKNRVYLAKLAHEETKLGKWEDKVIKNVIATQLVYQDIKDLKTVGVISEDKENGVIEIVQPLGPIFAVTPVTNPTSTVLFKILIALKSRNPIIIRPHGAAKKCSVEAASICYEAALNAGAPEYCIQWVKNSTKAQTLEFMGHRKTALVLATGSVSLVKAAHSSGNPALGVGPGNVPAYIGKSADVPFAVEQIFISKTFDNGTVCASEQALVVRKCHEKEVIEEFKKRGAYFLSEDEIERVGAISYNKELKVMNAGVIGQPAPVIARMALVNVPPDTTLLIARIKDVGIHSPLSMEILAPILAFYTVESFEEGIEMCRQINVHGGLGHTASIFSNNEKKIRYFASVMNAGRILVNTPASQGALGGTYNMLQPSLTLGCGTGGKNITTDNISARHLLNIQRIAVRKENPCVEQFSQGTYFDESINAEDI
ncbi:MAG: aldehyde dehydrogenase family protein [Candidatus Aminicenantes bacterium]|nr:aldehyde dehydrogenase family protein [Candidatus Aminicenantes bacterium]NIN17480.1 aldehyde dehydrogenase family protein [Candidatus Aminicenantes bacterium]NIN41376.1 aldehyde dehydrogenase family protein [Candidatus Aminicenantes bacterium]NIN84142.1 aldehyde dehydrogenase family protein [Candidatus Aminicenantes bacterium]NIO80137.1 aldehyde dehydrogenase family protein [Candidatus Aminicenantes bacterium]